MGHHRAERRGPRRRPSGTRPDRGYVGRRVAIAGSVDDAAPAPFEPAEPIEPLVVVDFEAETTEIPAAVPGAAPRPAAPAGQPGRRRAVKHAGPRGPLFKVVPPTPVLLGVATLAVAVGGAVTATGQGPDAAASVSNTPPDRPPAASALSGNGGVGRVDGLRSATLSRSSDRDTLAQATDSELKAAAEAQAEERNAALGQLAVQAEQQARKIEENQWVLPLSPSIITATFGEYGLWSSYHTGLDFNGNTGDPIYSIANGVVTFTGYDGAYGNKTVVTLEDGTELWYCHQTTIDVAEGDVVTGGEVIGTVGVTGNVTGSHLHVEVRPGGGDPVDPYAAFVVHGVTP